MENTIITPSYYPLNSNAFGRIKIWEIKPEIGHKRLLVDKPNLIVNQGSDIMANALAGQANSKINYFYLGYSTDASTGDAVAVTDTCSSFTSVSHKGFLRLPLAFPPSYLNETGYSNNAPYFTTFITSGSGSYHYGSIFASGVTIFSLGLVNGPSATDRTQDRLFSKVNIDLITYDDTYGLALTWGVTFRTAEPAS